MLFAVLIAAWCAGRGLSADQQLLTGDGADQSTSTRLAKHTVTLPLMADYSIEEPVFLTQIGLGSPPQLLTTLIDLSGGRVMVRGSQCLSCGRDIVFEPSNSSTATDLREPFYTRAPPRSPISKVYRDFLRLNAVELKHTFGVVESLVEEKLGLLQLMDITDGVLGLAPPNRSELYPHLPYFQPHKHDNFMLSLLRSDKLEHRSMTLSLPREGNGALTFGSLPSVDFRVPFSHEILAERLIDKWKVNITRIDMVRNGESYLYGPRDVQWVTAITLDSYAMALPGFFATFFFRLMDATYDRSLARHVVDCGNLSDASIVVQLSDHTFTFTAQDLVQRMELQGREVCVVLVRRSTGDVAELGVAFAKKYDLVFDMENDELGLMARCKAATSEGRL